MLDEIELFKLGLIETEPLLKEMKLFVGIEEGRTVFVDENALLIHDPDHSDEEERFVMLGLSARLRVLIKGSPTDPE